LKDVQKTFREFVRWFTHPDLIGNSRWYSKGNTLKRELQRNWREKRSKRKRSMKTNQVENTQVPQVPKVEKKLTFAELVALTGEKLYALAKETVKTFKALDKAKTIIVENLKFDAKVVAAMKARYTSLIEEHALPADTSFKKYFGDNTGGKLPGRVEALASLFNALVNTVPQLLTEENFDTAAVDWLEKANAIVSAARKQHGDNWKTCDEVLETITALSKPGDAAKTLREIRKRQKGETDDAETPIAISFTPTMAADLLIIAIQHAGDGTPENAKSLFQLTQDINDTWKTSGVAKDQQRAWFDEIQKAKAAGVAPHVNVVTETPETVSEEVAEPVAA